MEETFREGVLRNIFGEEEAQEKTLFNEWIFTFNKNYHILEAGLIEWIYFTITGE